MSKGIKIHGKTYLTVAERVNDFRDKHKDEFGIITKLVANGEWIIVQARIENAEGRTIATGFAEELRGSSQINKTSALENCETSAIGRALANLGFGGTEYASANEVQNAIHQQNAGEGSGTGTAPEDGKVSPTAPAKGWREPDSPLSTPTKLSQEMRRLERELMGCGDSEMVYSLNATDEWKEFVRIAEKHAPHYLRGGDPAPPEFEGLQNTAERMVREFDAAEAEERVAMVRAG